MGNKRNTKRNTKRKTTKKNTWISPIPRKIHFIWIGGEQPDYFKLFLKGFHKLNPEFQIKVWSNKELNKKHFPITYPYIQICKKLQGQKIKEWPTAPTMFNTKEEAYKYSKWAQITDLMRLEIVFREGGYYMDTTFQCLKPLYSLFNCKESFVGCNEVPSEKVNFLSNSFFGSTKNNPILKRLLSVSNLNKIDFRSSNVAQESGPTYLRSGIQTKDDFKILPTNSLYPYIESWNGQDPPYRKASTDKCYSKKKTKEKVRLKNKKGYLEIPCKKYPKSYAIKHWVIGKSWLIDHYYIKEGSKKKKQVGGVAPCVPCLAAAAPTIGSAVTAAVGACTAGAALAYKCVKDKLTKKKKKKNKKNKKNKKE